MAEAVASVGLYEQGRGQESPLGPTPDWTLVISLISQTRYPEAVTSLVPQDLQRLPNPTASNLFKIIIKERP